jgi:hypothetical protein
VMTINARTINASKAFFISAPFLPTNIAEGMGEVKANA